MTSSCWNLVSLGFHVNWDDNGFATFHEDCWFDLKSSYKSQESNLTKEEKEMVKEAIKTAEIHNSYDKVQREAEHIANLIKNSKYCIAITG